MDKQASEHIPVFGDAVAWHLITNPHGVYVDGTFGRGGHTRACLAVLEADARVIAIDQDMEAITYGKAHIKDARLSLVAARFDTLPDILSNAGVGKVDGVLLDIGVSSPQLDTPWRGFSFQHEGPLDMRMNTAQPLTARAWLEHTSVRDMAYAFKQYGQVPNARRVAESIKTALAEHRLTTTRQLAELVAAISPKPNPRRPSKRGQVAKKHPATTVFQAIRMAVNQELTRLDAVLEAAKDCIKEGGRLVLITFHSLEHQRAKRLVRPANTLPHFPVVAAPDWRALVLLAQPTEAEITINPRARSARLSVFERTMTA